MGKNTTNQTKNNQLAGAAGQAGQQYNTLNSGQTSLEKEVTPLSQEMYNNFNRSMGTQTQDYSDIMGGYKNFASNMAAPKTYSASRVSASRPAELGQAYGYLNQAAPGYTEFSQTGGYSPTDIQELRARGTAPIRSAYSNTMMELNRSRALGGAGGSPNYIAALSRAQRELPEQLSTATTGVNAQLADAIRQGKLSGLAGLTGIGGEMGGLASAEAGRSLQAEMANQGADLQAQGLNQNALNSYNQAQLAGLGGQQSLYGTTPAMAATFGNQALSAYGQRSGLEQMRNQYGLGLLDTQLRGYGSQTPNQPWWKQALGAVGSVVPYLGGLGGSGMDAGNNAISDLPYGRNTYGSMPGLG